MKSTVYFASLCAFAPSFVRCAGSGNPWTDATTFLTPQYAEKVTAAVANMTNTTLQVQAALVAKVPTFFWMDTADKVSNFSDILKLASMEKDTPQVVQAVIYDLPDRDCSANASAGEFSIADDGATKYKAYIDSIAAEVNQYPDVRIVFVVEPDGLANLVTNLDVPKCTGANSTYREVIAYAISNLQQSNVWLYLDAGHSGWLGWPANLSPAATLFSAVLNATTNNATIQGFATDVSNYNQLRGDVADPAQGTNPNYNEERYINALIPLLQQNGVPTQFIVDQGRSGRIDLRGSEAEWCNINGAGLGLRPTTDTGNTAIDSIVWVKPPGDSDGTSDPSSTRFDSHCALNTSVQPAPEAGVWFQSYFEMLVENANPPLS
ncbi:cellulase [Rickenella mellea]|uniref:Glucanase n=1 Tax=Rickenella mellea TaxID=50990 RepID=A0A4Y7Q001_9AGAM|nr:cellulase [Rickenella mellea]